MCSTWSDFLISIKYFPRCCLYLFPPAQNKLGFTHTSLAEAQCVQPKLRAVRNLVPQEWLLELSPRHDHRWEAGVLVRRDHCQPCTSQCLYLLYLQSGAQEAQSVLTDYLFAFFMGVGILMAFIWVWLLSLCLFLYVFFPKQKKIF